MHPTHVPTLPDEIRDAMRQVRQDAEKVGGSQMADEFDFIASTYLRACVLAESLEGLPPSAPKEARERDLELLARSGMRRETFHKVVHVLYAAFTRERTADVNTAVVCALEILRGSALEAYGAARERAELRKPPTKVVLELLPFDEEDQWLSGGPGPARRGA